jgi:hypothetical protein
MRYTRSQVLDFSSTTQDQPIQYLQILVKTIRPLSYRSPKAEVRESKIHGRGLFTTADIHRDEIVAVKGGHIVDRKTLREKISSRLGPVEIQIDDDLFVAPVTDEERELSMLYLNHSCDPNLGIRGEITFVAMRDIWAGEELTHDWATTDDDDYSVECKCGAPSCRKILTGKDWQRPELQKRYRGYFSAHLARKIVMLDWGVNHRNHVNAAPVGRACLYHADAPEA